MLFKISAGMLVSLMLVSADGRAVSNSAFRDPCRSREISELLDVIRDPGLLEADPERVYEAMRCLGWRHAVEAIPDLVKLLTFRYTHWWEKRKGAIVTLQPIFTGTRFPATDALAEIGKPALPALVKVIETHEADSLEAKNARYTIRTIFRYDAPSRTVEFFKETAAKASTPEAAQRLLKALEKTAEEDWKAE